MNYICLDTNTWIYLANGTEPVKLLNFIEVEVSKGNITILLPELIISEWKQNKENAIRQGTLKHYNDVESALNKLAKLIGDSHDTDFMKFLLDDEGEDADMEGFKEFISHYKRKKTDIESAITRNIQRIEALFESHATIIPIGNHIYVKAGKYALEKKAPFKNKNSFADALIVFSFLNYVNINNIESAKFISYNTSDFCEKTEGKQRLHPDLIPEFKATKSFYYKLVGEALKTIKEDILTQDEIALIEKMRELEEEEYEEYDDADDYYGEFYCEVCEEYEDYNVINFYTPWKSDQQIVYGYDPNQLELSFAKGYPKATLANLGKVDIGHCEYCPTNYFQCECGTINVIHQDFLEDHISCKDCGLQYNVDQEALRDRISLFYSEHPNF